MIGFITSCFFWRFCSTEELFIDTRSTMLFFGAVVCLCLFLVLKIRVLEVCSMVPFNHEGVCLILQDIEDERLISADGLLFCVACFVFEFLRRLEFGER